MRTNSNRCEKVLLTDSGCMIKIVYEIICDKKYGRNSYGIAISTYSNDSILNDFVEIPNISEKFVEINTLLMVLYKYEVTPITLYDVLDVILADYDLLN